MRLRSKRGVLNGMRLMLHRLDADGAEVIYDGLPVTAYIGGYGTPKVAKTKDGSHRLYDFVAKLPAGRWKIASIAYANFSTDLCFGVPGFNLGVGEVFWLGDMTLGESGGYPIETGNLPLAKSILAEVPALAIG